MEELQEKTVVDSIKYDESVSTIDGERQKVEGQCIDNSEPDLIKDVTNNESSSYSCGIESSKSGQVNIITNPDGITESTDEKTNEELTVKEEPETDYQQHTGMEPEGHGEDTKSSIPDDVLALFPFVCGICYEKFKSLATYFMHIAIHENLNIFLHSCDQSFDKDNVLFSCGVCKRKYPTLCALYEHLVEVECVTDFIYREREKTAYAYIDNSINSEIAKNNLECGRDREKLAHNSNEKKDPNISENSADINLTGECCIEDMQDSADEFSDNTIVVSGNIKISENINDNRTRKYISDSDMTERNCIKKQKRDKKKVNCNNRGKIFANEKKKVRKQNIVLKHLQLKQISSKQNKSKNKKDDFCGTGNDKFKNQSSTHRKTQTSCKNEKGLGTDTDMILVSEETSTVGDEEEDDDKVADGCKDNYDSQKDTATEETTEQVKFSSKYKLTAHKKQVHVDKKKFICDECGQSFKAWPYLKQHRRIHVKEKTIQCTDCPMKFRYAGLLREHMKTHSGYIKMDSLTEDISDYDLPEDNIVVNEPLDSSFSEVVEQSKVERAICGICGKQYRSKDGLRRHVKSHSDNSIKCSTCTQYFESEEDKDAHIADKHRQEYMCDVCGKKFKRKSGCNEHIRNMHDAATSDTLYKCPFDACNKHFIKKTVYLDHLNKHSAIQPYSCSKCSKSFHSRYSKTAHEKVCVSGDGLMCSECGISFLHQSSLNHHKKGAHGQLRFICACGANYKYKTGLFRHKKKFNHD